jgi:DNA-binding SARP family transcriptional activator/Tol biopolymer transport system component
MLRLRTLGGLSIENAAATSGLTAHRRPLAVLALLAAEGRKGLSRDKIVALLWPDSDSERGRNSLSQVISLLRRELAAGDVVLGTTELRVNTDVLASDVIEFEQRIAAHDLEAAIALYTGPFLDGVFLRNTPDFERWVDKERSRLHHVQEDALEQLATRAAAVGDHAGAVRFWRQRVSMTPSDSRAAFKLMESLVALGDPAGALEHYRVHHSLLRDDLGLEPDSTLAEFAASVRGMSRSTLAPTDAPPNIVAAAGLSGAAAGPISELRTSNAAPRRRAPWITGAVVVATLATVAVGWRAMRSKEESASRVSHLTHLLADSTTLHSSGAALSPDGRTIVYAAVHEGPTPSPTRLYALRLGEVQARMLEKTDGASYPFFSPDGASVGFTVGDAIKTISLEDGGIKSIATRLGLGGNGVADASWSDDGYILIGANMNKQTIGIRRVSVKDGSVEVLSHPDHSRGERAHYAPQRLPGTATFIYTVTISSARGATYRVVAQEPGGAPRDLIEGAILARYIDGGWLVYQIASDLFVSRFDVRTLALSGRMRLVEGVHFWLRGRAWAVNADILVYQPRVDTRGTLVRVSRDGTRDTLSAPPDNYEGLNLSPSGDRIALLVRDGTQTDAWTYDLHSSVRAKVSSDGITGTPIIWTPDGKRLTFRRRSITGLDVYSRAADGTDGPELLFGNGNPVWPAAWTRDMRTLVVMQHDTVTNGGDLWTLDVASTTLRPLVRSPASEFGGRLSPDGRWLAYFSDGSGRYELFVTPFPDAGRRWQVSRNGASEAVWSRDGRELFFRNGKEFLVAAVRPGANFDSDPPRVLFEGNFEGGHGPGVNNYDVSPDGRYFLIIEVPPPRAAGLNVFQGWRSQGIEHIARNR